MRSTILMLQLFIMVWCVSNQCVAAGGNEAQKFKREMVSISRLIRNGQIALARSSLDKIQKSYIGRDKRFKEKELLETFNILLLIKEGEKEEAQQMLGKLGFEETPASNKLLRGENTLFRWHLIALSVCDEKRDAEQIKDIPPPYLTRVKLSYWQ